MTTFEDAKVITESFCTEVTEWCNKNKPQELNKYSELKNKEIMGNAYRNDQNYYEKLSQFKAKFIGLRGYFLKMQGSSDRITTRNIDTTLTVIDEQIKLLDTDMFAMRSRLKFYETIIFMIANFSFGDF